jgi:molybdopterin/thiamine biosynthesis adenylyltransferase
MEPFTSLKARLPCGMCRCKDEQRSPNYRDLFPQVDATQIPNCTEGGVIPTLAGIIGCMQANEVIKYITKTGDCWQAKC